MTLPVLALMAGMAVKWLIGITRREQKPVRDAGIHTLHSGEEPNWKAVAALYVTPAGHCFHHAGCKHAVNPRARRLVACSLFELGGVA